MSSYLTIYGIKKEEKFSILSFSRSHSLYQELSDNLSIPWDTEYELTEDRINYVIKELGEQLESLNTKITEYKLNANGNLDVINEIISLKEYRGELEYVKAYLYIILGMVNEAEYGGKDKFDKIVCKVD